jgi:hypothetical protein
LNQLPDASKSQTFVVQFFNELPTTNILPGDKGFVTDTGDSFIWDGSTWLVLAEADWENVNVDYSNITNVPIATTAEAEAGTDNTVLMTPLKTAQAIAELAPEFNSTDIDNHIADTTIHFTQANITITESQISDLQSYELADATILKSADIGVTVQGYNVDTVVDANYETFDSSGTYANLRAQATTASDVGLGNVTNDLQAKATDVGNRTYTEENVVTNGETLTASIDELDKTIGDIDAALDTILGV